MFLAIFKIYFKSARFSNIISRYLSLPPNSRQYVLYFAFLIISFKNSEKALFFLVILKISLVPLLAVLGVGFDFIFQHYAPQLGFLSIFYKIILLFNFRQIDSTEIKYNVHNTNVY